MRILLLLSLLVAGSELAAQAPAPAPAQPRQTPAPAPAPAKPGQAPAPAPAPARPRAAARPAARAGVALTVTDPNGATLQGVHVEMSGASDRSGDTDDSGQVNFPGLQAGTYRLRFSGDAVTAFEREVTLRAGQVVNLDITLNPAPPPKEVVAAPVADEPPPVTPASVGPTGQPQTLDIPDILDKEFVGRQPRRDTVLACSGNMRTMMVQLNEPLPSRLYDNADAVYYVLGGEGTLTMDGRESKLATNGFVSVPRGTAHALTRRGNRPLVLLAVLGGVPCEEAK